MNIDDFQNGNRGDGTSATNFDPYDTTTHRCYSETRFEEALEMMTISPDTSLAIRLHSPNELDNHKNEEAQTKSTGDQLQDEPFIGSWYSPSWKSEDEPRFTPPQLSAPASLTPVITRSFPGSPDPLFDGPPVGVEIIFINAKQSDRVRKRIIAKQKLEERIRLATKSKKPQTPQTERGCMRRPRGPVGRFLKTPDGSFLTGEQVAAMTWMETLLCQKPKPQEAACSDSSGCCWMQALPPLTFLDLCVQCRRWKMRDLEIYEKLTETDRALVPRNQYGRG